MLKSIIILTGLSIMIACNSTNRLTIINKEKMFTVEQIKEKMMQVRTGADFPVLAMNLKNIGVTYYETKMEDGSSIFHGENGYELLAGPNYDPIKISGNVNLDQLKIDIANHQQGKSDYFEISRQSADNGIEKWAVCLVSMTCTYLDKAGHKIWVEHIPEVSGEKSSFTIGQIEAAHAQVKSGADFPAYIQAIKKMGVRYYETFVACGNTDYYGAGDYKVSGAERYTALSLADTSNAAQFKADLQAHQQGRTDFPSFCKDCARSGIAKWAVSIEKMTCTYYDKSGNEILVEKIP
jgi:uncharacterized protein YbcV (DUF1398 family)